MHFTTSSFSSALQGESRYPYFTGERPKARGEKRALTKVTPLGTGGAGMRTQACLTIAPSSQTDPLGEEASPRNIPTCPQAPCPICLERGRFQRQHATPSSKPTRSHLSLALVTST